METLVRRPSEAPDLPDMALTLPAFIELWLALAKPPDLLDLTLLRRLPTSLPPADFLLEADFFTAEILRQCRR